MVATKRSFSFTMIPATLSISGATQGNPYPHAFSYRHLAQRTDNLAMVCSLLFGFEPRKLNETRMLE